MVEEGAVVVAVVVEEGAVVVAVVVAVRSRSV